MKVEKEKTAEERFREDAKWFNEMYNKLIDGYY